MSERSDRLSKAIVTGEANKPPVDYLPFLDEELNHLEGQLKANGLSIVALLRHVAKQFYGVTVPPYEG